MKIVTLLALTGAVGLTITCPTTVEAQTPIRTQAKAEAEATAAARRRVQSNARYWDSYWNWYDSSYRPYYNGRSRTSDGYTDPRDRGYFGDRYNGLDIEDYQDWRNEYNRGRNIRDQQSLYRSSGRRSLTNDSQWNEPGRRYNREPQYDVWWEAGRRRSSPADSVGPGHFTGYGGGWR